MNANTVRVEWDAIGISASLVCLLHCLGLPFLIAALPAFASVLPGSEATHQILAIGLVIPAALAALPGYCLHRRLAPLLLIVGGVAQIGFAAFVAHAMFGEEWEMPVTVAGSLCLVIGHLLNRSFCLRCPECSTGRACEARPA
ncbi:MAG TPA: MerC domain-containing protein [Nevskiales bacterium]|nr:MerC domain-containing protein [Nevskiales bacterium]